MMLRLCAVALIMVMVTALLGEMGYGGKKAVAALSVLLLFCAVTEELSGTVGEIMDIARGAGAADIAVTGVKVLGVGYVFGIVSDICEEMGERGISSAVINAGRIEIFLLIFPYFKKILEMGIGLLR